MPTLIFCGGGNKRFYEIATEAGFLYGSRLPSTVYGKLYFADQEYKKPNRSAYMAALEFHRPHMATVVDWEREDQLNEVLSWAEEAAQYVNVVLIIPKVINGINKIPRSICGSEIRLAYSVPTSYGGTQLPLWDFYGWPVHLLGGSPHKQMEIARYINVVSADGNMAMKMANTRCLFWRKIKGPSGHWVSIKDDKLTKDATLEAFRRSCKNIISAWKLA